MYQGVISNLKAYYLQQTFRNFIDKTDSNEVNVVQFWKNHNILDAL